MTILSFLCRLFPGRCEPHKAEQPRTGADLGQTKAQDEGLREEQLRHMESGRTHPPVSAGAAQLGQNEAKALREEQLRQMRGGRPDSTKPKKRL